MVTWNFKKSLQVWNLRHFEPGGGEHTLEHSLLDE
jgi:hypothetical protein